MAQSLFSSNWHRIAHLQMRLRESVLVKRQFWRGELWYLLDDTLSGTMHRINVQAYQFIGRCDGELTVQQIWDALLVAQEDLAPTQDEVVALISRLNQLSLLYTLQDTDVSSLFERRREKRTQHKEHYMNPFAIRLPLGDPSKWLHKMDGIALFLFKPAMFYLWLFCILMACCLAHSEWASIMSHAKTHMLTPRYLTITFICFPMIKALHELCHGLAIRRWQGTVHEFGVSLLVLVPAPYVDASAANGFSLRSQRMVVSAAGIMSEMLVAAFACFIWLNTQAGLVQDIAFSCMVIGTVSTLVFNGNPLLRFDGYYVLSDYLDMPNLASRSQQYWHALLKYFVTFKYETPFELVRGERKWLLLYSPLSFAYKLFISTVIVLWLGSYWFLIGFIAAAYMSFSVIIKPIYQWVSRVLSQTAGSDLHHVKRNLSILGLSLAFIIFAVPLPFSTITPAIVWLPEKAQVRSEQSGFIQALPIKSGLQVKQGDVIAVLANPVLNKQREKLISMLDALQADRFQLLISNPINAANINEKINHVEQQLARLDTQISQLTIQAAVDGKLIMPKQQDMFGSYINRGDSLAYIFQGGAMKLKAVVPEKDAYLVRNQSHEIDVWMAGHHEINKKVRMIMDTPAATSILPSAALGDRAGGPFVTDPADESGTALLSPVFLFDLVVPNTTMKQVGNTAYVKFKHNAMPLAAQLYRRANQLFVNRFEPSR